MAADSSFLTFSASYDFCFAMQRVAWQHKQCAQTCIDDRQLVKRAQAPAATVSCCPTGVIWRSSVLVKPAALSLATAPLVLLSVAFLAHGDLAPRAAASVISPACWRLVTTFGISWHVTNAKFALAVNRYKTTPLQYHALKTLHYCRLGNQSK